MRTQGLARSLVVAGVAAAALLAVPLATLAEARAPSPQRILSIARDVQREHRLKAVILEVRVGNRRVVSSARGESMTGVPATTRMRFRIGNVAIGYLGMLLLRLHDQGRVSLDDRLSRWYPRLPQADRITLRMLGNSSAGYPDYVPDRGFQRQFYADPFANWTPQRLIDIGTRRVLYPAGTSWNYSHTGFVILGEVLTRATRTPLARLMQREILGPLRLRDTVISSTAQIPEPVLHAFTRERGRYEESTYWNPTWTTARGAVMTSTIADVARGGAALGSGALLSAASRGEMTGPTTAGLGSLTHDVYYGMGVLISGRWVMTSPSFAGYAGATAYLPSRRLTIAVTSTKTERAQVDGNFSIDIVRRIAREIAPDEPFPAVPGGGES
jgi:D-alanyl-D-alanine carboxypeptidase